MEHLDEPCSAKLAEAANWIERVCLAFKPFQTHLSRDGFVLYKKLRNTLFIYANGHFVFDEEHENNQRFDGGYSKHWDN